MPRLTDTKYLETWLQYGIHVPSRTLLLTGPVDESMKNKVLLARTLLDGGDLTIILDTEGGDVYQAFSIYDTLKSFPTSVKIVGLNVMSAGALILQAADEGERYLRPNATVMIHQGRVTVAESHPEELQRSAKEDKRIGDRFNKIIADAMGLSLKQYREKFRFEVFMDASQAVGAGVADHITSD